MPTKGAGWDKVLNAVYYNIKEMEGEEQYTDLNADADILGLNAGIFTLELSLEWLQNK